MEDLFNKFKNFILPAFILIQILVISLKKLLDKKKDVRKRKKWEEYEKRLGLTLKETIDSKQPYMTLRISNFNSFLIDWPISGGIIEGIAIICAIKNIQIDKNFSITKKLKFREKKSVSGKIGFRSLTIENEYVISGENENFKRKLLNSRVITHILSTKPESLSFFDKKDTKSMLIPEKANDDVFFLAISKVPENYNKLNEFIEMCRIIVRTLEII